MTLRERLVAQFRRPQGRLGRLAGWIMAHRPSNCARNLWTLDLLALEPQHRVLEVGFGPGFALGHAAERARAGSVWGIDHSETMCHQAARRNRTDFEAGRIHLLCGSIEIDARQSSPGDSVDDEADLRLTSRLLSELGRFDRIYSANVAQFWKEPRRVVERLYRLLEPGGRLALTFQPRHRSATADDATGFGERFAELLSRAGYDPVAIERLDLRPVPAICVLGERPVSDALREPHPPLRRSPAERTPPASPPAASPP